jgi:hypothetical protein
VGDDGEGATLIDLFSEFWFELGHGGGENASKGRDYTVPLNSRC